jgi:hypothetical protein
MTTVKIVRKRKITPLMLIIVGMVSIALLSAAWFQRSAYSSTRLQQEPILLDVPALAQSQGTSCGEAVIAMAYNYAYPETPISEAEVIAYASENGYFTEDTEPFTSPANMVKITRHYAGQYDSGRVISSYDGLALLVRHLRAGQPVIIDVITYLDDPQSDAHFVLVTGISVDPADANAITIHYNNPLTGQKESAPWNGDAGIWHAWQNNPDPGGPGWWLVIGPD